MFCDWKRGRRNICFYYPRKTNPKSITHKTARGGRSEVSGSADTCARRDASTRPFLPPCPPFNALLRGGARLPGHGDPRGEVARQPRPSVRPPLSSATGPGRAGGGSLIKAYSGILVTGSAALTLRLSAGHNYSR